MKIILWSEFPEQVDFKKLKLNFPVIIYVAVRSKKEFLRYKKYKHLKFGAWPVLDKKDGYWFSGYTSPKNIDHLDQFEGLDFKIDLEYPLAKSKYKFLVNYLFKRPKHYKYLKNKIDKLSEKSNILINEMPLPKFLLKSTGVYYKGKVTKNIMFYSTIYGLWLRPLIKFYYGFLLKTEYQSCSIGLIGPGIFKTENFYENINQFKKDLELVEGFDQICIYSLESILKRKDKEKWFKILKNIS